MPLDTNLTRPRHLDRKFAVTDRPDGARPPRVQRSRRLGELVPDFEVQLRFCQLQRRDELSGGATEAPRIEIPVGPTRESFEEEHGRRRIRNYSTDRTGGDHAATARGFRDTRKSARRLCASSTEHIRSRYPVPGQRPRGKHPCRRRSCGTKRQVLHFEKSHGGGLGVECSYRNMGNSVA